MKVSIGHLTYEVHRVPRGSQAHVQGISGRCHMSAGHVCLYAGMSPQEEASTLLHELLHAIWHAYALPDEIAEEDACRRLEGPLMALMADNPQVIAGIIAARMGTPLNLN